MLKSNQHGLVALEKPVGTMSHPNHRGRRERCLLEADYDYEKEFYMWQEGSVFHRAWLLNRLDSPTSGVLLLALDETIVPTIRRLFAEHRVQKTYYALVKHTPSPLAGCWKDILKQAAYQKTKVSKQELGRFAQTYYKVISHSDSNIPVSMVKLMPVTGRTHQLRIQCNYHRHPIVGDRTHGDFTFNRKFFSKTGEKRMMLHSSEIVLDFTFQNTIYNFSAKSNLPEAFTNSAKSPV